MVATPWGGSESLRERRLPPGPGRSPVEVKANQRERLSGALVASVAERGYAATRVADLVELSGVSSRSFYDLFPDKERCLLATLEGLLEAATEEIGKALDDAAEEGLQAALERFAAAVAAQPAAAKLCLLEAYAAGPEAVRRLTEATAAVEARLMRILGERSGRTGFPREMVRALVGALLEVTRRRLRRGEEGELPGLVDDLAAAAAQYVPPPRALRLGERPVAVPAESLDGADHVDRILRAVAVVVAEEGYADATVEKVVKTASISGSRFYAHFRDKEDAVLAAIDSACAQMVAAMMPAFRRNPDRPHGVRAALAALFSFLASRPALASLAMVEVHAAGPAALELREEGLRPLSILLGEASVRSGRMPDVGYEGIVGAVLHLAEDQLRRGEAAGLPTLTPLCAYIALAPLLGAEAACAVANGEGDTRGAGRLDPHAVRAAGRDPIQRLAILALVRGPLGVPALAESLGRPEAEVTKHLEELVGTGVLERGADPASGEDVYRYPLEALDAERWGELDADERRRFSERIARLIELELHQSLDSGEFDRVPETVIVRLALLLDEQGWREISDLHSDFMWSVLRAQEESHKRMAVTGEKGIEARTVQLHFRLPQ